MPREERTIATNKKAFHDYTIEETFEAGIALTGTEVKSLRENRASLRDSFATVRNGEVWLHNVHIAPYSHGNRSNVDPDRTRKLLLHKNEIRYLIGKTKEKGLTLVPLRLYFSPAGRVKVELGLARGKKLFDKREAIAEREHKREVERALKDRTLGR
ncbi:SsrA-binding protein SmpB [Coriobacteriia bacterium Es71-Z0120]|uniref:SsrA-binding protein SmpB n=1 Tax=Parvivirga hydrogeniphila TaxID=2939460 RepID=UPI002260CB64|nr:SsrA-binding protein SmpB [Parvivirga hydrogeniphila]MCL4078735.1 SsrA-binding protein SmpB [Parvivirga hydrogeniphila]